jgi:hypothetical protein
VILPAIQTTDLPTFIGFPPKFFATIYALNQGHLFDFPAIQLQLSARKPLFIGMTAGLSIRFAFSRLPLGYRQVTAFGNHETRMIIDSKGPVTEVTLFFRIGDVL